ncbi:hypothetical protein GCM10010331_44880 [Streptomyces xanthochromogenes]|uniref:DUF397 domain-containing protein n=1 Tax=Streptomyces xanthochromogenes TaxID=67384 RepID=UPI001677B00E|nr:DUF397 domain-containing protein [Streptomyces xanthochromogenes]GHB52321.1 hypothetical protein GCM10010331_44880 [Streptomyces xanthochromogenes]
MMRHDLPADRWIKSSYSGDTNGQCLEYQALGTNLVAVDDSKQRSRGAFVFPANSWHAFVEAVKQDQLH